MIPFITGSSKKSPRTSSASPTSSGPPTVVTAPSSTGPGGTSTSTSTSIAAGVGARIFGRQSSRSKITVSSPIQTSIPSSPSSNVSRSPTSSVSPTPPVATTTTVTGAGTGSAVQSPGFTRRRQLYRSSSRASQDSNDAESHGDSTTAAKDRVVDRPSRGLAGRQTSSHTMPASMSSTVPVSSGLRGSAVSASLEELVAQATSESNLSLEADQKVGGNGVVKPVLVVTTSDMVDREPSTEDLDMYSTTPTGSNSQLSSRGQSSRRETADSNKQNRRRNTRPRDGRSISPNRSPTDQTTTSSSSSSTQPTISSPTSTTAEAGTPIPVPTHNILSQDQQTQQQQQPQPTIHQIETLQRDLRLACEVGQQLLKRTTDLEKALSESESARQSLQNEVGGLREEMEEQRVWSEECEAGKVATEGKLEGVKKELVEAQVALGKLRAQVRKSAEAEVEAELLRKRISSLDNSHRKLETLLQSTNRELETVSGERQSLLLTVQELYDQMSNFIAINRSTKASCSKQVEQYNQMIATLQEEKLHLAVQVDHIQKGKATIGTAGHQEGSESITRSIQAILADVKASSHTIQRQKDNADMEALRGALKTAEAEKAELLDLLARQQETIQTLQNENNHGQQIVVGRALDEDVKTGTGRGENGLGLGGIRIRMDENVNGSNGEVKDKESLEITGTGHGDSALELLISNSPGQAVVDLLDSHHTDPQKFEEARRAIKLFVERLLITSRRSSFANQPSRQASFKGLPPISSRDQAGLENTHQTTLTTADPTNTNNTLNAAKHILTGGSSLSLYASASLSFPTRPVDPEHEGESSESATALTQVFQERIAALEREKSAVLERSTAFSAEVSRQATEIGELHWKVKDLTQQRDKARSEADAIAERLKRLTAAPSSDSNTGGEPVTVVEEPTISKRERELENTVTGLKGKLEKADKEAAEKNKTVQELKATLQTVQASLVESERVAKSVQESHEALTASQSDYRSRVDAYVAGKFDDSVDIDTLKAAIMEAESRIVKLTERLEKAAQDNAGMKDGMITIGAQLAKQSAILGQLEWRLREKEDQRAKAVEKATKLEEQKTELEAELHKANDRLKASLLAAGSSMIPVPSMNVAAGSLDDSRKAFDDAMKGRVAERKEAVQQIGEQLRNVEKSLDGAISDSKTAEREAKSLNAVIEIVEKKIDSSVVALEKESKGDNTMETRITELNQSMAVLQKDNEKLQSKVSEANTRVLDQIKSISKLETTLEQLRSEKSGFETRTRELEAELEEAKKNDASYMSATVDRLEEEKRRLHDSLTNLGAQLALQSTQKGKNDWELKDLQTERDVLKNTVATLEGQVLALEKTTKVLADANKQSEDSTAPPIPIPSLECQRCIRLEAKITSLREERDRLQSLLEAKLSERKSEDQNTTAMEKRKGELLQMISDMRQKLDSAITERDEQKALLESKNKTIEVMQRIVDEERELRKAKRSEWESGNYSQLPTFDKEGNAEANVDEDSNPAPRERMDSVTSQDLIMERLGRTTDLQHRLDAAMRENNSAQAVRTKLEQRVVASRQEINLLKEELRESQQKMVDQAKDLAIMSELLASLRKEVNAHRQSSKAETDAGSEVRTKPSSIFSEESRDSTSGSKKKGGMSKIFGRRRSSFSAASPGHSDQTANEIALAQMSEERDKLSTELEGTCAKLAISLQQIAWLQEQLVNSNNQLNETKATAKKQVEEMEEVMDMSRLAHEELEETLKNQIQEITDQLTAPRPEFEEDHMRRKQAEEARTKLAESLRKEEDKNRDLARKLFESEVQIESMQNHHSRMMRDLAQLQKTYTDETYVLCHLVSVAQKLLGDYSHVDTSPAMPTKPEQQPGQRLDSQISRQSLLTAPHDAKVISQYIDENAQLHRKIKSLEVEVLELKGTLEESIQEVTRQRDDAKIAQTDSMSMSAELESLRKLVEAEQQLKEAGNAALRDLQALKTKFDTQTEILISLKKAVGLPDDLADADLTPEILRVFAETDEKYAALEKEVLNEKDGLMRSLAQLADVEKLSLELATSKEEIHSLRTQLQTGEKIKKELESANEHLTVEQSRLSEELATAVGQVEHVSLSLRQRENEALGLRHQIRDLETQLHKLESDKNQLTTDLTAISNELSHTKLSSSQKQEEISRLRQSVNDMETLQKRIDSERDQLVKDLSVASSKISTAELAIRQKDEEISSLRQQISELDSSGKMSNQADAGMRQRDKEIISLRQQISELLSGHEKINSERAQLKEELKKASNDLINARKDVDERDNEHVNQINALNQTIAELEDHIADLKQTVMIREEEILEVRKWLSDAEKELDKRELEVNALTEQSYELRIEKDSEIERLSAALADHRRILEDELSERQKSEEELRRSKLTAEKAEGKYESEIKALLVRAQVAEQRLEKIHTSGEATQASKKAEGLRLQTNQTISASEEEVQSATTIINSPATPSDKHDGLKQSKEISSPWQVQLMAGITDERMNVYWTRMTRQLLLFFFIIMIPLSFFNATQIPISREWRVGAQFVGSVTAIALLLRPRAQEISS
ncbi:hypothetical protein HDU76_012718 [Blyttiomyces sp. JEL0837]|nr:hypothetical protein HDU76_012718 [Blyttiomyces sp. JEL0837]